MTGTVKVYEIAEDLKLDTETVLQKIQALGNDTVGLYHSWTITGNCPTCAPTRSCCGACSTTW